MKKTLIVFGAVALFIIVVVMVVGKYKVNFFNDKTSVPTGTRYFGNEVKGDFNGDGQEDSAYLFTQDGGGSGTFYYVTVKLANGQELNAILLGDRIAPQTTEYRDGKIIVNYADRKPNEPMTTRPSVGVSKYLEVVNNQLVEIK